ncbi:MAG TPA: MFS transporter [Candidatus Microsaccharimonas sp.]|nr:MFS transporter [Candidatus Microsaccharimonas sp.]
MTNTTTHRSAQDHAASFTSKQRTIALVIVAFAFIMDLLDNTIVNIAIPSIQANLGASYATIQWLIAGYALTFATLLITGGRMGDVFGYKKIFMAGVAGFTLASLFCGVAWNSHVLIAARLLQGCFAALMVPQVMSLMQVMYKPEERGSIMGIFGAMAGIAATLGPVVGGILIHFNIAGLDWRPIFLINIPVGLFAFFTGFKYLPDGKSPHPLRLDLVGTVLVSGALLLLVYPLIQGRELGWPTWSFVMMAAAFPVLAVFARWQQIKEAKDGSPLIVPLLMKTRTFVLGLIINLTFESAMLGFFLPFTLLLQVGLGYSVIKAALTGIPTAIGISVAMAVFSQKIIPKLGRYTMVLGVFLMAGGLALLYTMLNHFGSGMSPWAFIPGLLLVGAGMALIMSPMFSVALVDIDAAHAGSASGVLNAVQQLGGAIGTALLGLVFFTHLTSGAAPSFDAQIPQLKQQLTTLQVPAEAQTQIIEGAKHCFADRSNSSDNSVIPASCKQLTSKSSSVNNKKIADAVMHSAEQANTKNFVAGFRDAITFELCILAIIVVLSFSLPRHIRLSAEVG